MQIPFQSPQEMSRKTKRIKKDKVIYAADAKGHVMQTIEPMILTQKSYETDPQGSWTGAPIDADEQPVQDVDDL